MLKCTCLNLNLGLGLVEFWYEGMLCKKSPRIGAPLLVIGKAFL